MLQKNKPKTQPCFILYQNLKQKIVSKKANTIIFALPIRKKCPCGGIGRRARLKIWFSQGSAGSIPVAGTTRIKKNPRNFNVCEGFVVLGGYPFFPILCLFIPYFVDFCCSFVPQESLCKNKKIFPSSKWQRREKVIKIKQQVVLDSFNFSLLFY